MSTQVKVGFVGLGNMGGAMVRRLLAAGHSVKVWNRTASKAEPLMSAGAKLARSPREAAEGADLVITMLADDAAVSEVVHGKDGFLSSLSKGATHIAMSTISIELSQRLEQTHADAGQRYVAAPVLGRPDAAEEGKLFIFGGGEAARSCEAVFSAMSQKVFWIDGPPWRAHLIKLACNFMLASAIETMSEAFALTSKGGVEREQFLEIFSTTLFAAPAYKNYGAMIASGSHSSGKGFKMPLAAKDIRLALAAGEKLVVPMPCASAVRDQMLEALGPGYAELDWSALGKLARENSGQG